MINTNVKIWYGWEINATNYLFDFKYASDLSDRVATLRFGRYSTATLIIEIKRALREAGTSPFTVTFDRSTKKFTISSGDGFNILASSGVNVSIGCAALYLGYSSASDKTGTNTYTAENICLPYEYTPQFKLQSLTDPVNNSKLRDPVIAETASGQVELAHFGVVQMCEFEIVFITDILQRSGSAITNNLTGVADANRLLQWATKKGLIEFIPDSTLPNTYYDLILEKTASSQNGTEAKLIEQYAKGLPNIYNSGMLTWRVYEA